MLIERSAGLRVYVCVKTHTRTHARTHARTHTHTGASPALIERRTERVFDAHGHNWQQASGQTHYIILYYIILYYIILYYII